MRKSENAEGESKTSRAMRVDSQSLSSTTFFTPEGYLRDCPVLTSTGIFEYRNPDGSKRRELRLPEEVFKADSLSTYEGKPIIITHNAGLVDKNNVKRHQIGTILTKGYRDGEDVRANIVINDTNSMKDSGLKELSLGYSLDLEEKPGVWNGQPYDAIQRNIHINHLALVREARAGEQARLNIDGRDDDSLPIILKGEKAMNTANENPGTQQNASAMSPEDFVAAIEAYRKKMTENGQQTVEQTEAIAETDSATDMNQPEMVEEEQTEEVEEMPAVGAETEPVVDEETVIEDVENKDMGDEPMGVAQMGTAPVETAPMNGVDTASKDVQILLKVIERLLGQSGFSAMDASDKKEEGMVEEAEAVTEMEQPEETEEMPVEEEEEEEELSFMNMDSKTACFVNKVVREKLKICRAGDRLNMDGLEEMSIRDAKIAIINRVHPGMHFDGKEDAYIDAAFDMAVEKAPVQATESTANQQRKQMFNADSKSVVEEQSGNSAYARRLAMINRKHEIN